MGDGYWRLEMRLGLVSGYGIAFGGRVRAEALGRGTPPAFQSDWLGRGGRERGGGPGMRCNGVSDDGPWHFGFVGAGGEPAVLVGAPTALQPCDPLILPPPPVPEQGSGGDSTGADSTGQIPLLFRVVPLLVQPEPVHPSSSAVFACGPAARTAPCICAGSPAAGHRRAYRTSDRSPSRARQAQLWQTRIAFLFGGGGGQEGEAGGDPQRRPTGRGCHNEEKKKTRSVQYAL